MESFSDNDLKNFLGDAFDDDSASSALGLIPGSLRSDMMKISESKSVSSQEHELSQSDKCILQNIRAEKIKKPFSDSSISVPVKKRSTSKESPFEFMKDEIEINRSKMPRAEFVKYLFPTDIRLSYLRIIVDAFNTGHQKHLENALKAFCHSDCIFKSFFFGDNCPFLTCEREIRTVKSIAELLDMYHRSIPDAILYIKDFHVIRCNSIPCKLNEESVNKLLRHDIGRELNPEDPSQGLAFIVPFSFTGEKICDISIQTTKDYSVKTKISLINWGTTRIVKLRGTLVLVFDDRNKINRIESLIQNEPNLP